jgi:hypothetical protein
MTYGLGHVSMGPRRGEDRNRIIIEVGTNSGMNSFEALISDIRNARSVRDQI